MDFRSPFCTTVTRATAGRALQISQRAGIVGSPLTVKANAFSDVADGCRTRLCGHDIVQSRRRVWQQAAAFDRIAWQIEWYPQREEGFYLRQFRHETITHPCRACLAPRR